MGFSTKERFENLKCCVIIPTFNNCQSLENVIVGVLKQTGRLIVVNDGSTDETDVSIYFVEILNKSHLNKNDYKAQVEKAINNGNYNFEEITLWA